MKFKNTIKTLALTCLMMMGATAQALPLVQGTQSTGFGFLMVNADVNNDGNMDLIEWKANQYVVSLGNGQGSFTTLLAVTPALTGGVAIHYAGDVDADGKADLIITDGTSGDLYVATGAGDGTFSGLRLIKVGFSPTQSVGVADMVAGGSLELIKYDSTTQILSVHRITNGSLIGTALTVGLTPADNTSFFGKTIRVTDLNGDRNLDILLLGASSGKVVVVTGAANGGLVIQQTMQLTVTGSVGMFVGDVDSDNVVDIVLTKRTIGQPDSIGTLINNGAAMFSESSTTFPVSASLVRADILSSSMADMNGDGNLDMISSFSNKISVVLGDGAGSFAAPLEYAAGTSPLQGFVADINGDNLPDVIIKRLSGFLSTVLLPLFNQSAGSGTIIINNNAVNTDNSNVTLSLTCTDSAGAACANSTTMALLNDGGAWSTPVAWSSSVPWTLSSGLGVKTVSVRFTDTFNNVFSANDSINLVSPPPPSDSGCLAPSQSSALYLFMLLGLLFAGLQIRARKS